MELEGHSEIFVIKLQVFVPTSHSRLFPHNHCFGGCWLWFAFFGSEVVCNYNVASGENFKA